MSDLLIKNGLVITMDEHGNVISNGAVLVEDGRIEAVGKNVKPKTKPEEIIDARGKIVMPGLVCAHVHIHMSLLHGSPLDLSCSSTLLRQLFEEKIGRREARMGALLSGLELVESGVTSIAGDLPCSIGGGKILEEVATLLERVGLRASLGISVTDERSDREGARGVRENERFIKKMRKKRATKVQGMLGVGDTCTVSDELLCHVREAADRCRARVSVETSRSIVKVYSSFEKFGKGNVERLGDLGVLGPDVVLTYCVHLSRNEISLMKKSGAKVAHIPISDVLEGGKVAPVVEMRAAGIPVGLGGGGYSSDMFQNVHFAYCIHKLQSVDLGMLSLYELFKMVTVEGAKLYGWDGKVGSLEKGKMADILILDPSFLPTPVLSTNVFVQVLRAGRRAVETVMVGGKFIVRDRRLLTVDGVRIKEEAKGMIENLWKKLKKS